MFFWSWWQQRSEDDSVKTQRDLRTSHNSGETCAQPDPKQCVEALLDNRIMLTLDKTCTIHYVSENTLERLALDAKNLGTVSFYDLLHPTQQSMFEAQTTALPLQKRAQLKHQDGQYYWYALKYYPGDDTTLLVLEPINTLVHTEKTLRAAQVEVESSSRERGEFLRHMSHELRTPLNAILGFAEMMECGVFGKISNQAYEEYLKLIRESGDELLTKIVDLMDLSAIGSHHVSVHDERFMSEDMLVNVMEAAGSMVSNREVSLQLHHSDQPLSIIADKRLLRKALGHVIHNAIGHNECGVTIDLYVGMNVAGEYQIIIEDNGAGIAASQLALIQEALHHSDHLYSHVEAYRPIGLGLTLCKEYIYLHGGQVAIESRVGKGTVVTLTLPHERVTFATELGEHHITTTPLKAGNAK